MQTNIIKILEQYRHLDEQENLESFVLLIKKIVKLKNPDDIPTLLSFFSDKSEYVDVMQFLLTELEEYPPEDYIPKLFESLPVILIQAPEWLVTIVMRMFNNEYCLEVFKKNIKLAPMESMLKLLDLIGTESKKHKKLCDELNKIALSKE